MVADGPGEINEGLELAVGGPEIPFIEISFSSGRGLIEEVLESEPEIIGAGGFEMRVDNVKFVELLCRTSAIAFQ